MRGYLGDLSPKEQAALRRVLQSTFLKIRRMTTGSPSQAMVGAFQGVAIVAVDPVADTARSRGRSLARGDVIVAISPTAIEASQAGVSIRVTALTDDDPPRPRRPGGSVARGCELGGSISGTRASGRGAQRAGRLLDQSAFGSDRAGAGADRHRCQGRTVIADDPGSHTALWHGFTLRKALPHGEHIFGLGDKTGDLDRRGESFVDWNTDAYGFSSSTDPIYKSIPFFLGVGGHRWALTGFSSTIPGGRGSTSVTGRRASPRSARRMGLSTITSSPARASPMSSGATPTSPGARLCRRFGLSVTSSRATAT